MKKKILYFLALGMLLVFPSAPQSAETFSPGLDGAGFRVSLAVPNVYDVGFGLGLHADVGLVSWAHFFPNIEYLHAADHHNYEIWTGLNRYYRHSYLNEFTINGDFRFYPPQPPMIVKFFAGCGLAFVVSNEYYDYELVLGTQELRPESINDVGAGLNLLAGCDIPVGKAQITLEMKVKVGTEYTVFKVTGGLTFPLDRSLFMRR